MKSLSVSEREGLERYVAYQGYYSLIGRDYEAELMPLAIDQGIGLLVWSPLGWARLTGKIDRKHPSPPVASRLHTGAGLGGPQVEDQYLFDVVDALKEVAKQTEKTIPQVAINWLLQRPTVANVILGARNEEQLKDNLGSVGWNLSPEQIAVLDKASQKTLPYPYWHQQGFKELNPPPVTYY